MKGITPIIATIVLLLITMGLLAMAYTFMSGLFNVQKSFAFPTGALTCNTTGTGKGLSLYVYNTGQENLTSTTSFDIFEVNGAPALTITPAPPELKVSPSKTSKILDGWVCPIATCPANSVVKIKLGIGTSIQETSTLCP